MHKRFVHLCLLGRMKAAEKMEIEIGREGERERERLKEQSGRTIEITSKNFAQGVNEILDILS